MEFLLPHNHFNFLQGLQCAFLKVFGTPLIFYHVNATVLCSHALIIVLLTEPDLYLSFETGKKVLILAAEQVLLLMAVQDHVQLPVVLCPHSS